MAEAQEVPTEVSPSDARRIVRSMMMPTALGMVGQPGLDDMGKAMRLNDTAALLELYALVLRHAAEIYVKGTQDTEKVTLPHFIAPSLPVVVPDTVPEGWADKPTDGKSQD